MSVSAFPYGAMSGGAAASAYTVALTNLQSIVGYFTGNSATAGVRVQSNGNVSERSLLGYTEQNPASEWCDANGVAGVGSDFEARLTASSGSVDSGPSLSVWHTISSDLTWEITHGPSGTQEFVGTLEVREIANTGNSSSATVTIRVEPI